MSTTTNLALNEPAYNSTSPTWDQPLNYNSTILDQMFGNTTGVSVNTSGAPTYTNIAAPSATAAGSTSQAMRFNLTGALAANQTVLLPQGVAGMWIVTNSTSGAYTITFGSNNGSNVAAGTTVILPQSYSSLVYCDGTNVKLANDGLLAGGLVSSFSAGSTGLTPSTASTGAVTLAGTLSVGYGGTGITTTPSNGALLIGNGSGYTSSTLTAGSGVTITNGTGSITIAAGFTQANAVTTSGASSFTFTNIPSTAKIIIVNFSNVSFPSGAAPYIQLGSGSIQTTGYNAQVCQINNGAGSGGQTTYFPMAISGGSNAIYGAATFVNLGNNIWTGTWSFYFTAGSNYNGAGAVILTGTLDRLILNLSLIHI